MRQKRTLIIVVSALLVLTLAICTLPWPTRVDMTMNAAAVTADGTVLQEGTVEMKGWILDYLFKTNEIKFTSVNIMGNEVSNYREHIPSLALVSLDYLPSFYPLFTSFLFIENNRIVSADIALSKDLDWCFLRLEDGIATESTPVFIAASASEEYDVKSILNTCAPFLD